MKPVCNCCLSENFKQDLYKIYKCNGKPESYTEMLFNVFNIQILHNNPRCGICDRCILRLRQANLFKNQIVKNQRYLLALHENAVKSEEDNDGQDCAKDNVNSGLELDDADADHNQSEVSLQKTCNDGASSKADSPFAQTSSVNIGSGFTAKRKRNNPAISTANDLKSKRRKSTDSESDSKLSKFRREKNLKKNSLKLIVHSNMCPFKWHRNKYKCFCCTNMYTEFSSLRQHYTQHSVEEITKIVTQYNIVKSHKVEVTSLTCNICSDPQEDLKSLRKHFVENHHVKFADAEDVLVPYLLSDSYSYKCAVCKDSFDVFHKLNMHMNTHFQNYICKTCGLGFIGKSNFKEHSVRAHGTKYFKCYKCNIDFSSQYQRDLHAMNVHKKGIAGNRACPYCSERFSNQYNRLIHMINVHSFKRPEFVCNVCERTFIRKSLLNSHVRKCHMSEKNHGCSFCDLKFFNKHDMTRHMVTHTGEKAYVCNVCDKSYARKYTLTEHMKSHST